MGIMRGRAALLGATACIFAVTAPSASAQRRSFDVSAQAAETGIVALGHQADIQIIAARKYTSGKRTGSVRGEMTIDQALGALLQGTGLVARQTGAKTYVVLPVAGAATPTSSTPAPAAR